MVVIGSGWLRFGLAKVIWFLGWVMASLGEVGWMVLDRADLSLAWNLSGCSDVGRYIGWVMMSLGGVWLDLSGIWMAWPWLVFVGEFGVWFGVLFRV